jgi:hypothetical protein
MARHLHLLPRRQLGVGLADQALDLNLQLRDLVGDRHVAGLGEMPQLLDLAFQLGDRLLEIQEVPGGPARFLLGLRVSRHGRLSAPLS